MSLLIILISLALERFIPPLEHLRGLDWFATYSYWIRARFRMHHNWRGTIALVLTILLPVIAIGVLQMLFAEIHAILAFVYGIAVLSFSLGPYNTLYVAHQYQDALEQGNTEVAQAKLERLLPNGVPTDEPARAAALVEAMLIENHDRLLALIFWFVVLGPMGAVLYLLAAHQAAYQRQYPDSEVPEFRAAAAKLHDLLAWIPCRLTALSYAVMGSFVHALQAWEKPEDSDPGSEYSDLAETPAQHIPYSHALLLRVGLGALQLDDHPPTDTHVVRETFALCLRSVITWLTILALLTLAGWLA